MEASAQRPADGGAAHTQSGLVSVVIVNWNTRELLLQCIRSMKDEAQAPPLEIIVVDNASSDGSVEALRAEHPDVMLISSDSNLGFAAANNAAAREAGGEFVLFLNPDTIVQEGAVLKMLQFLQEHPDAGAVGCRLLNADRSVQESYWMSFPGPGWLLVRAFYLQKIFRRVVRARQMEDESSFEVAHLLGACMMMRLSTFREIGGFDESYFLYLEETDLCYRLREAGRPVYHTPDVAIVHLGQQSSSQAAEWTNAQLYDSMYRFTRKHRTGNPLSRAFFKPIVLTGAIVRLALWSVRFAGAGDRKLARRMLRGYWRLCLSVPRLGTAGR